MSSFLSAGSFLVCRGIKQCVGQIRREGCEGRLKQSREHQQLIVQCNVEEAESRLRIGGLRTFKLSVHSMATPPRMRSSMRRANRTRQPARNAQQTTQHYPLSTMSQQHRPREFSTFKCLSPKLTHLLLRVVDLPRSIQRRRFMFVKLQFTKRECAYAVFLMAGPQTFERLRGSNRLPVLVVCEEPDACNATCALVSRKFANVRFLRHIPPTVMARPTKFNGVSSSPNNHAATEMVATSFAIPAMDIGTTPAR